MINELTTSLNLATANIKMLFSYYFYKEDNTGLVLRYNEEGYLFSAFVHKKTQEDKYGLVSPLLKKESIYPDCWIQESIDEDCSEFHYVLNKLIKTLPDLTIQKIDNIFKISLEEVVLQDEDFNTLLLRVYLIKKYGEVVDYYKEEIEYDKKLEKLKYPYANYQVFPIVGSMHGNYGNGNSDDEN